jgi:hypothetical protein
MNYFTYLFLSFLIYLFSLQCRLYSIEWCVDKKEDLLVFGDRLCHVLRNYLEGVKCVWKQNVSTFTFFYEIRLSLISGHNGCKFLADAGFLCC